MQGHFFSGARGVYKRRGIYFHVSFFLNLRLGGELLRHLLDGLFPLRHVFLALRRSEVGGLAWQAVDLSGSGGGICRWTVFTGARHLWG